MATQPIDVDPVRVDLVIDAGWVVTVDAADTVLVDGSVAVDDGTIVATGSRSQIGEAFRSDEHLRLPHHVVLPGFVNAHTHLAMTMFRGFADDRDLEAFLARLLPVESAVLTADRVRIGARAGMAESVLAGTTTALDMYFYCDAALQAADELGFRLLTGPVVFDGPGPGGTDHDRMMEWAATWLAEHPNRAGWRPSLAPHSTYLVSPDHLAAAGSLAADHGATLHLHAAETAAEVDLVRSLHGARPVELLGELGLVGPHTVLAHGVHLTDEELGLVAISGAAVAHCPASNMKLGSGVARVPELLGAAAVVGLGTDGPASSNDLDLFGAMRVAALIHKGLIETGLTVHGGKGDATNLSSLEVLRMATMGGATALGVDDAVGSLEAGKRADLIAVDLDRPHTQPVYDPVSTLVYAAGRADVDHVWIDGRRIVSGGVPLDFEVSRVAEDLRGLQRVVLEHA